MNTLLQLSLLSKPIRKFPNTLIYNPPQKPNKFLMCNKKGEFVGMMSVAVRERTSSSFYKCDLPYKALHIGAINIFPKYRGKGYGSDFIKFAKRESYKQGCDGKVSLVAYFPGRAPHLFYYKKGFITPDKKLNDYFDNCIKTGQTFSDFSAQDMFLPLKKEHFVSEGVFVVDSKSQTFVGKLFKQIVGFLFG